MNIGQHSDRPVRRAPRRARRRGRLFALLAAVVLVSALAVGGTVAFILTQTEEKVNVFAPAKVACTMTETFDGTTKRDVAVKNTGDTVAYIRAAVIVTWMKDGNAADQNVTARLPQEGTDYTLKYTEGVWLRGADGYWYYPDPVAPGDSTGKLIESCVQLATANAPDGYHLSVEIAASAIQSVPETVVADEWHVVLTGGKIAAANGKGAGE